MGQTACPAHCREPLKLSVLSYWPTKLRMEQWLNETCRSGKTPAPMFINLDNVLTVERQGDLTTVLMVGGEKVYIDTMPETLIGAVTPPGSV